MYRQLMLVLVCLLFGGATYAQDTDPPLIAVFNEQIYQLQGDALVAYDACMPDERLTYQFSMSPDRTRFAFMTLPRLLSEAAEQLGGMGGDGPVSFNIWLCDVANNRLTRIYATPGGDEAFSGEIPLAASVPSMPQWSPDGKMLVWSTINPQDNTYSLVSYDAAAGLRSESPLDLPPPFMFPVPPGLLWGIDHLYLSLYIFNEETYVGEDTLFTYDLDSNTITNQIVLTTEGESDDFIVERLLVQDNNTDAMALRFHNAGWVLADVNNGEQTPINGLPELVASDTGRAVLLDVDADYNNNWQILGYADESGNPFTLEGYPIPRIALSPDGSQLAYADSTLHIWSENDGALEIGNSSGFADDFAAQIMWATRSWRISQGEVLAQPALSTCEGAPPSRLKPGTNGRVLAENLPNRVRMNPSAGAVILGQIPASGVFLVLDGPLCAEGYAWYQVDYGGMMGWTAEGSTDEYFIEPVP